jgi:hypothetical protein
MRERVLRRGRVIDAEGRPVAGAFVSVTWGTAPTPDIARKTGNDGGFQVGLPPGKFRIRATASGSRSGDVEVEGGEGDEIVITLNVSKGSAADA